MLQAIRSKTASIVVKALAGLLIVSFAAWGVEDFISARATDVAVASVGERDIDPMDLENELARETQRLRQMVGGQLTDEQLLGLGIGNAVLQRLINDAALALEARKMGLLVSDERVTEAIHNDPTFHGFDGRFSRQRFDEVLRSAGMTEQLYIERVRIDLANTQLLASIDAAETAPAKLASMIRAFRYEKRSAAALTIKAADQPDPGEPSEDELKKLHEAQSERFTAPEYRNLTFVHLSPDTLLDGIEVTEEDLQTAFEINQQNFIKPERRTVQQMVLTDEETAKVAEKQLAEGRDFLEVATEVAEMDASAVDLGTLEETGLLPVLADAVFAVDAGAVTAPVKSPLGWHIFKVTDVDPGETKTLDDVRDQVRDIVARERAVDALYDLSIRFEDSIGGGATLEEAAESVGLQVRTIESVDRNGKTPNGADAAGLPEIASLLPVAFSTEKGLDSPLTEIGDKGYFMVRVDDVTPPTLKPFDQVRDEVAEVWKEQKRIEAAEAKASEIADLLNGGTDFRSLAMANAGEIEMIGPVSRSERDGNNANVVARMFELDEGKSGIAKIAEGYKVLRVTDVQAPLGGEDVPDVAEVRDDLNGAMAQDIAAQLIEAMRADFGVKINQRVFEAVIKPGIFDPTGQF